MSKTLLALVGCLSAFGYAAPAASHAFHEVLGRWSEPHVSADGSAVVASVAFPDFIGTVYRWTLSASGLTTETLPLDYAQVREAFGAPIASYQGVTFPLADSATELHAAHLMGLNAAQLLDQGQPAIKELSMTKAYSVQVGVKALDRAIQAHGAMGFTNELGLTEAWHSLRVVNVADGTNEILYRTISQRLLKGDLDI